MIKQLIDKLNNSTTRTTRTERTEKAGNTRASDDTINHTLSILTGDKEANKVSTVDLIDLNTGWVSICNSRVAECASSIPLKLYYDNKSGKQLRYTAHKQVEPEQARRIKRQLKGASSSDELVEITEHPLLSLFENINDVMNYYDWCSLNFMYQGILGNSYNEIICDTNNRPIELKPLLAEYITPIATGRKEGKILYYSYDLPETEEPQKIPAGRILHFVNYVPGNMLLGKGELENCMSAQQRYLYYDAYEKYLGINNSRPDFAVNYKTPLKLKDLKQQYRLWNRNFKGSKNSGKVVVTGGDYEIKTLGLSPRDMQYQIGREWARQEICAAYGVPKSLVTTDDVNLANSIAGMNQFLKLTIFPKMVRFCSKVNEILTPLYDDNLYLWFEEQYLEDPAQKQKDVVTAYSSGIISRNEARSGLGYEPVKDETQEPVIVEQPKPKPETETEIEEA